MTQSRSSLSPSGTERLLRETFAATTFPPDAEPSGLVVPARDVGRWRPGRRAVRWALPVGAAAIVALVIGGLFVVGQAGVGDEEPSTAGPTRGWKGSRRGREPVTDPVAVHGRAEGTDPATHGHDQAELQQRLGDVATKIDNLARVHDPAFGFVAVESNAKNQYVDGLAIYRAANDPASVSELYAQVVPKGLTLSYGRTLLSQRQTTTLDNLVKAQEAHFQSLGIRLTYWGGVGYNQYGGRFAIGYDTAHRRPSDALLRQFEIYGPDTIVLIGGKRPPTQGPL